MDKGTMRAAIFGYLSGESFTRNNNLDNATLKLNNDGSATLTLSSGRILYLICNKEGHVVVKEDE